jgi:topoisomerase IA-like protein
MSVRMLNLLAIALLFPVLKTIKKTGNFLIFVLKLIGYYMFTTKKISKQVLKDIAAAARSNPNILHVAPKSGKWVVRKHGAARAMGSYVSQEEAISEATRKVNDGKFLYAVLHNKSGSVAKNITRKVS